MATGRVSDTIRLTEAGVDEVFNRAAKAPSRKYWQAIVNVKPQKKQIGNYVTLGDFTSAEVVAEGDSIIYDKVIQNNETHITTVKYGKGAAATMEQLDFDLENIIKNRFGAPLVTAMQVKKEKEVAAVYNNAFTATGADGVAQIADNHPLANSVSVNDNLVTGALSTENIKAAKTRFTFIYNQAGDFFDTMPTHLLIHPAKQFQAFELLNSALLAWELSNTKNSLQDGDMQPLKVLINPYLTYTIATDVSPWFLLDKGLTDAGVVLQTKGGLQLETEWDFDTSAYKAKALEYYGAGMVAPGYGLVGSTGA